MEATVAKSKFLRIGHAGAGKCAPPNTLRSFELALHLGVDMVEFDVRHCRDGIVLHHDASLAIGANVRRCLADCTLAELRRLDTGEGQRVATLDEALSLIKGRARMNLDLKEAGYEDAVLDRLRRHGVAGDVLTSSLVPSSLRAIKALAPEVSIGLSYPDDKGDVSRKPYLAPLVKLVLWLMRLSMPWRAPAMIASARADAVMLHQAIITPRLVSVAHRTGYRVFAWTVDELATMQRLRGMGVDGIASNRPDLFAQL